MSIEEYNLQPELFELLRNKSKGILVSGAPGSGKSTLIQHFNALIQPTSGQILYNGEDVWAENYNRRALRSEVGLVFQ